MSGFSGTPPLLPQAMDPVGMWRDAYSQGPAPADDGKVQGLSRAFQVEPEEVRENLTDFQARFAAQQLYSQKFKEQYPTLSQNLVRPQFVSRVRDDMGNLIETEGWWNEISNAYNVARDTVAIGNIGTRAMLEGRDLYPYERLKIQRAQRLQQAHMASQPGWVASAAELLGTMQETLGYSLAASAATTAVFPPAAPFVAGATAFATSFNLEAGNLYADLIMDGYTPAQASNISYQYGALIAGFETLGLKFAGEGVKNLGKELFKEQISELLKKQEFGEISKRIFGDYAKGVLGESFTEGVQEVLAEAGKLRASELYREDDLYEPEYMDRFLDASWHTFKGMVILGGIPAAGRLAIDNINAAESFHDEQKAKQANQIRQRSRTPDAQEQVDREAGETSLNSTIYIRAQDFMDTVRAVESQERQAGKPQGQFRRSLDQIQPGLMRKLEEAAARDGDVEISQTDFDKAFSRTTAFQAAFDHVARTEGGMTVAERTESQKIRKKMMVSMKKDAAKALQDLDAFEDEMTEIRQEMRDMLTSVLEDLSAEQTMNAAANSSILAGFIRRSALAMGITPREFVDNHLPRIARRGAGPAPKAQPAPQAEAAPSPDVAPAPAPEAAPAPSPAPAPETETAPTEDSDAKVATQEEAEAETAPRVLTQEAQDFLSEAETVVFDVVTDDLKRIAKENGVEVTDATTPQQIIDEFLSKERSQSEEAAPVETKEAGFDESAYSPEVVAWAKDKFRDRVAPNGRLAYQNFLLFFGNSKVLDRNGAPRVMFHGTPSPVFNKFDYEKLTHGLFGMGIYTTASPRVASGYAREGGVYPFYVSIENPLDMDALADKEFWEKSLPHIDFSKLRKQRRPATNEDAYRLIEAHYKIRQKVGSKLSLGEGTKYSPKHRRWIEEQRSPAAEAAVQVQDELFNLGFDGITHVGGGRQNRRGPRHRVFIAFDSSQVKSVTQEGNFSQADYFFYSKEQQKQILGTARLDGTGAITQILLDPKAKPTTLMHELMHWNLELLSDIGLTALQKAEADRNAMEKQILDDVQRLLSWSGYKGTLEEWRTLTPDKRRPFHEAIAVSFEVYLYEGKAPNRELRTIFQRLADFIRGSFEQIVKQFADEYKTEFRRPLPGLNDDVRAIFGRMMSSERDVQLFLDHHGLDIPLMSKVEWANSGLNINDYDEYEKEFRQALEEAKAELTQKRMAEIGYQDRARQRVGRSIRKELRGVQAAIKQEVEAEVRLMPVYQLRSYIRSGKYQTATGENRTVDKIRTLDRASVEQIAREMGREDIVDKLASAKMLRKEGGLDLESVREMFQFDTVEQMLEQLADSRSQTDEVVYRTDERMLNEHSDLTDPVMIEERIQAAIHNKVRQRLVALELRYILNNGRARRSELNLAKEMAEEIIANTPTGDINLSAYNRAAARARKKALKAFKDGDLEAAAFAKRQELLNESLIIEGKRARDEVRKLVRANERAFRQRSDQAIAKSGKDVSIVKGLRGLLATLGIGRVDKAPSELLAKFGDRDPEFASEVKDTVDYFLSLDLPAGSAGDRRKAMERLKPGDVRSLRMLINRFLKRATDVRKVAIGEKKQSVEEATQEALDQVMTIDPSTRPPDDKSIFGRIRDYFSDIIRFEHLFRRIDGGEVGPWTQMFRLIKDAANNARRDIKLFLSKDEVTGEGFDLVGKLRSLDLKIPGKMRRLTAQFGNQQVIIGGDGRHAKTQLIHLAMHYYGNASNRERLVRGYAGKNATPDVMEEVAGDIGQFLEKQIEQGLLTKKDFDFMQSVFDKFSDDDMLGKAQEVMLRLRGYEMTPVEATKFIITLPDGTEVEYAGGYIPVRYETPQGLDPTLQEENMSVEQQAKKMLQILPGFTKDRVGIPDSRVKLDLSGIQHHAAEVYRFIHLAEPATNVYRVVSDTKVRAAFVQRFGNKAFKHMEGWLKRSAYQKFDKGDDTEVANMLLTLSRNANMGVMFLNIGNTLQNYAGLVIPMRRVGKRRIISALIRSAFSKAQAREIAAKSTEMKARLERQIFDIYSQQQKILTSEDSAWARLQDWSGKYAYVLQQITQNHVDVAVWQAAYNQETEKALGQNVSAEEAERRAVAYADSIVRQSQMAGEKEDLSAFEAGGPISRALFPFKSWFINWMNNAATQRQLDMNEAGWNRAAALSSTYIYMLMVPAILAMAATELARGEDFDDEDDGYGDDMTELFFRSQLDQVAGGLPFLSDVYRMMSNNWTDDKHWNNRYPTSPWQRAVESFIQAPTKFQDQPVETALDMAGQAANMMGVPASGIFRRASLIGDEIAGELESQSTYDLIRGAVTGQRSDLQRLSQ